MFLYKRKVQKLADYLEAPSMVRDRPFSSVLLPGFAMKPPMTLPMKSSTSY